MSNSQALSQYISQAPTEPAQSFGFKQERRLRWAGYLILLLVFGVLGGWAAYAPLSSAAHGQGQIAVSTNRKAVQHLEGGIVKKVFIREGDLVAKDQDLIELDEIHNRAQFEVQQGQLWAVRAKEARLLSERDRRPTVTFPAELLKQRQDPRVADAINVQEQAFRARLSAQEGENSLYARQIESLQAKFNGLKAQRPSRESTVKSYSAELADFKSLLEQGYADKQKVRDLERNLDQSRAQLESTLSEISSVESQIDEIRQRQTQIQREMQREVAQDLALTQAESAELRTKIVALSDNVRRNLIKAPQAGVVIDLNVFGPGAVVRAGVKVMDIVPQDDKLLVEVRLAPQDIDQVKVGQMAEVRLASIRQKELPRIEGQLMTISGDRLVDEKTQQPYFLARVEISPDSLAVLRKANLTLQPGMPMEVLINTGERTMWTYLTAPLTQAFARSLRER